MNDRPSFMASHGGRLADNGYAVIPIMPGSKVPGRFTASRWVPYPDWTRHADRTTKPFEIDIWQQWPDCGVGIACGAVVGIDIDVTDAALAIELASLATSMLGDTSCLRIGQSPKRLLVYRAAEPFAGRKRLPLEVLARGQQFVAHAIHPGTGQPYTWPEETLLDVPLAKLPPVDEAGAMAWLDRAHALIPPELRPRSLHLDRSDAGAWTGPADPRGTYEAVKAALAYLPNEDLDGASWITMGNAIKAALGEQGRELWLDWSRQSTKSGASGKADTPERRWKSLRPTRIGAGSIYEWAIDRGWVPPPEITLNAGAAERAAQPHPAAALLVRADATSPTAAADVHPAAALLAKLDASRAKQQAAPLPVPAIIMQPGGVLQMLVEECVSTALRPQPFLALGAAICAVGVLAGRKYRTRTDLRTNIYVAAVAESGGGKDHAPEVTWGVVTAMPPVPRIPWTWDDSGALEVQLESGTLDSATALEVLNGENAAALIGVDGTAEVIQFRDAENLGSGRYRLTTLLRGRRGTEDQIPSRGIGDVLVLLDDALRFQAATAEITATRHHRAPSIYETVETAAATVTKAVRGRTERPYAPAHLAGSRDEDGNLTITWIRRTRVGGGWADGTGEVPLSEATEAYEVEILDGDTVVRTITGLSAPTATYTAAEQAADFGVLPVSVTVCVFQLSAIAGRGIAAKATL